MIDYHSKSFSVQDHDTVISSDQQQSENDAILMDEDESSNQQDEDDGLENSDIVDEIVSSVVHGNTDIEIEPTLSDISEVNVVKEFIKKGCGCRIDNGGQCSLKFSFEHIMDVRSQCLSLSHDELDLVILGQIMSNTNLSTATAPNPGHANKQRQKSYSKYSHGSEQICSRMFLFLHTIGKFRLNSLVASFKLNGLTVRIHGNSNRKPHNALSLSSLEYCVKFLLNYADLNAVLLPGRIPGYSKMDIKLLPSSVSKHGIWQLYKNAAASSEPVRTLAYSTFNKTWKSLLPSIIIMKPMSDLCWTCQQNSTAILRAANQPDIEKSAQIKVAQDHLLLVQLERSYYKATCDSCRLQITNHFSSNSCFDPPPPHCNT